MPDTKITALTALTAADPANDVLPIVDVSDTTMAASGTTKKISINNVLGASGTATLASATISGDLTVDTSTLKVDSANNRVGINTATPQQTFEVVGGTAGINTIFNTGSAGDSRFELRNNNVRSGYVYWDTAEVRLFADTSRALTFYQNGTLGMTLNSTGLGIGVTPSVPLDVRGPFNGNHAIFTGTVNRGLVIATRSDGLADSRTVIFNAAYSAGQLGQFAFQIAGTDRILMKNNGQLRFVPLASDPAGAEAGDVYYNSTSNKLKCYNGTTWNDLF